MPLRVAIAGAGQGLGRACARALAKAGARLLLCARTLADVEALAAELTASGSEATALAADVGDDAGAALFAQAAFERLGEVDLGLICVGDSHPPTLLQDATRQLLLSALDANAVAPVLAAGALLRGWEAQRRKSGAGVSAARTARPDRQLIFLSSLATRRPPLEFVAPYTAGKFALEALVRALAEEAWPSVRVNALCLGPVATRLHARGGTPPEIVAQFPGPDEIAPLLLAAVARLSGQSGRALDLEAFARAPEVALRGDGRLAFADPIQPEGEPFEVDRAASLVEPEPGRRPSPRVRAALRAVASDAQRYPAQTGELRERLAALHAVPAEQVLLSGGGATELIERALRALCSPGDEVLSPFPTFEMVSALCSREGLRHRPLPARRLADGTFAPHTAGPLAAAAGPRTRLVYLASPDNPTGALLVAAEESLLRRRLPLAATVIVDEAWSMECALPSDAPAVASGAPLLRIRSLSKLHGLASLRIGYALASPEIAQALRRLELPFPLGAPQLAAALAVLADPERIRRSALLLARERARVAAAIRALGLVVSESTAPVLLIRDPRTHSGRLAFALRAAGCAAGEAHWDAQAVVFGLGTRAQNRRAVAALARTLS